MPTESCETILKKVITAVPALSVLVLAYEFPMAFDTNSGNTVYFGATPIKREIKSRNFHYIYAKTQVEVKREIAALISDRPKAKFDLIFIDHHHALSSLIEQINLCLLLSHPDTLFLFDDAVPPDIAFTGPTPTREWWVGEVWMLGHLLRAASAQFKKWIVNLPPTGLLAARNFAPLDPAEVNQAYECLSSFKATGEIAQLLSPLEDPLQSDLLLQWARTISAHDFLRITASSSSVGSDVSCVVDAALDWARPELVCLSDLSGYDLDLTKLLNTTRRIHAKVMDTFSDVVLTGFDGFLKGSTFFSRTITTADSVARRHVQESAYSRTILSKLGDELIVSKSSIERATRISERVFFGTPDEPDNYGMWILYAVPSVYHFLTNNNEYDTYLTYLGNSWQRKMLGYLGVSKQLREHRLETTYFCEHLTLVRHSIRNLTVSSSDRQIFRMYADRFSESSGKDYGEKIFISRLSPNRARSLLNEEELISGLAARGFAIIQPELLEFPQQIKAFVGAKVIVGLGGAGLFNAVFARPETLIITIESSLEWVDAHINLFSSCGLNCGVILGRQDISDPEPFHKRWTLDIQRTLEVIDCCLT